MGNALRNIGTLSKWEVKRFAGTMSRDVLPISIVLFILLIAATGLTQQSGMHLQDDIYTAGIDSADAASVLAGDERFQVYMIDPASASAGAYGYFDITIIDGIVSRPDTEKASAALNALDKDYTRYRTAVYNRENDIFAVYPLLIDEQYVISELDFLATQSGQLAVSPPNPFRAPVPSLPVEYVTPPADARNINPEEFRFGLIEGEGEDSRISRYTDMLTSSGDNALEYKTPSQLAPPLPFDSIILVFVFVFPLYFTSQFFMMSIMNERIGRSGEPLLASPLPGWQIILGKGIPYFLMMLAISTILTALTSGEFIILLPLIPVIFFFLANALLIGMTARSFKELSFISIFFSTVATSYIFFPSIFANIHVVSLVSPLTLIILQLQGDGFTFYDFNYSTSLFFITGAVIFYLSAKNFTEERLFNYHRLIPRLREFIRTVISDKWTNSSLFAISAITVPFVFMAQMMVLVLFFNLPMPYSLIAILVSAAFIEELAKSVGVYTLYYTSPEYFSLRNIIIASLVIALGFLAAEKLLLFATLAEITESVFGEIMFASLQVLWLPLSLHMVGVLTTISCLKIGGRRAYGLGLIAATIVHVLYNLYFILGWGV